MILLHQLKSRYPRYPPIFFGNAQMAVDMGQEHFLRKADPPVWWDFWWKLVVPKNWANKLPVSRWWFQSFPFLRVGTFILVCNHDPNLGGGFKGFFSFLSGNLEEMIRFDDFACFSQMGWLVQPPIRYSWDLFFPRMRISRGKWGVRLGWD